MDKALEKRLKEVVRLLKDINESALPMNLDKRLTEVKELEDKKLLQRIQFYASISRMHFIHLHGKIKDECQEFLNDEGFAIEKNINKVEGLNPFYIRTEKGLITF